MDNSASSMSKALSSRAKTIDSPEESGWTFYFEDFLCNNDDVHEHTSFSSGYENPSLVSDAASSVAKKVTQLEKAVGFSLDTSCKKLSFKKRKTKGVIVGDALEDTASSPVNSPKVCYFNQLDMNRKEKENMDISEEKGGTSGQTNERSEMGIVGRDSDYTDLKKRGLCLVPVSTLTNYLG